MEWPLKVDFGGGFIVNGSVSLSARNGDVFLEFRDEKNETFLIDTLSRMQTVQFDDADPLKITMKGDDIFRVFNMSSEEAVSGIWTFFQKYQKLVPMPGKHKIFAIRPKITVQTPVVKPTSQKIRSSSIPLMPTAHFSVTPEAIVHGIIRESLSDIKVITVTEKNYKEVFNERGELRTGLSMSEVEISPSFVIECWKKINKIQEFRLSDYRLLKEQINKMQKNDWETNPEVKDFVDFCDDSLKLEKFKIDGGKDIAFNALIAAFIESKETLSTEKSFVHVVSLITNSLLAGRVGENFVSQSGDCISQDEASSIVFTLFDTYLEKMKDIFNDIYSETMQLLLLTSPSTNQLILNAEVKDFEFMKSDFYYFFCKERNQEDSVLILTGAFSAPSIKQFARSLIAASFTLLHNRLVDIANQQPALFCDTFLCLIPSINVRVLLQDVRIFTDFIEDEK